MKLSDTTIRKFVKSFDIDDYEIMTDDGWKDCKAIHKTIQYDVWHLVTENHELKCADTHIVFDSNMNQVFVKDLVVGQKICTDDGLEEVKAIEHLEFSDNMYDIELGDESQHRYYTNGILSHNTTTYTIFCLWYATLFADKRVMICANKLATASEIIQRISRAYEQLPFSMKPAATTYNKTEIMFSNGSSIKACSTSSSAARGSSCNCLVIDEMAFIPKNIIDEFFASVIPVVSSSKNSKIIVVSTPNGASGMYYDIWQAANSKDKLKNSEGWKPFRINWWEAGGIRDEEWKKQQIATIGIEKWKQEFECDFLTSASTRLIPDDIIEKHRIKLSELKLTQAEFVKGKVCKILSEKQDKVFDFIMWYGFDKTKTYAASGDVAEGGSQDDSVLYIWDITDLKDIKQCAKFDSNTITPTEFAYVAKKLLELYGNPYFICERNGLGSGFLDSLKITYDYENIVHESKNNDLGVVSHVTSKAKACLWTRDMMTTDGFNFSIYDPELLKELGTFCKKDTKGVHLSYCALPNCHDDHVMAFVWFCYLLHPDVIEQYYIVAKSFTTTLGNQYPELVCPLKIYSSALVKKISDDPIYQEFLDFKEDLKQKLGKAIEAEINENNNDIFDWNNAITIDPYFGEIDNTPNWRNESNNFQQGLSYNNYRKQFFII